MAVDCRAFAIRRASLAIELSLATIAIGLSGCLSGCVTGPVIGPGTGVGTASGQRAPPRPNIVLIMADDVGVEAFGCYGGESYATPHIDALAASGVRYRNAHSSPLCTPSRVKLMTGRSNARNYAWFSILDPSEPTFGTMLRDAGYATAVAGKWQLYGAEHYGPLAGEGAHPRDCGFDSWCLWQIDELGSRYWDPRIEQDGAVRTDTAGRYGPDLFGDYVCRFIEDHQGERFFVYYPMVLPHSPFVPTPDSEDRRSEGRQQNFADMIAYLDALVGRIVGKLDALGLRERTLVVFTSDNGTHPSITSIRHALPVQGGKARTTDAGTHVPFVVSWPGVVPAGATSDDLVDFADVLPTLADAARATPPDGPLDGRSLLPGLRGRDAEPRRWLYCYYNPRPGRANWPERRWVRSVRFKLYGDGRLFDVLADPDEQAPIAVDDTDSTAQAARRELQDALDSMPARSPKLRTRG